MIICCNRAELSESFVKSCGCSKVGREVGGESIVAGSGSKEGLKPT